MADSAFSLILQNVVDAVSSGNVLAFSRLTGMPDGTLRAYLTRGSEPTRDRILAIARSTGVSLDYLLTGEGEMLAAKRADDLEARAQEPGHVQLIPVLGEVPAGVPMQRALTRYADEHIRVDLENLAHRGDSLFALRIVGDSMIGAGILNGDYAVCSMMSSFNVGDVVAVYQTEHGESTVKQLGGWDRKTGKMLLIPHNLVFEPFAVHLQPEDQVRRVVAVVRRYPLRA